MVQHANINHSGLTGVVSFGSNSNSVTTFNGPGASASNSRADHVHLGVTSLAHTSNTYSGPVTLTAGANVGITSPSSGNYRIDVNSTGGAAAAASTPPRHGCLVYHNTTQTVNGAQILFNSEIYDSDAYHSTVTNTGRITIPASLGGLYYLEYGTNIPSMAAGEFCRISINGGANISTNEGETDSDYVSGFCVYPLVAGDYVQVIFTGNRTVGHASAYEAQSHFSASLLGT